MKQTDIFGGNALTKKKLAQFLVRMYYTSAYNIPQRDFGLKQHEKLLQELQGAYSDWKSQMMACCSVGKQHASPQHAIPHSPLWIANC